MLFSSLEFLLLFLPILLFLYFIPPFRSINVRNALLLGFSIFFYAWGEPVFVFIMGAYVIANWFLTIKMDKLEGRNRKILCTVIISLDVLLIFIFKYLSFFLENIRLIMHNVKVVQIALPIGISFFTFQMMSYVFDVYYKKTKAQKNLAYVALYVYLFPQLIAGPIVRYTTIEEEITSRKVSYDDVYEGLIRFGFGLGKKVLIANKLGSVADAIFNCSGQRTTMGAWLGMICYSLQIFYDFSGYSDMAVGLGRILGFRFPKNFDDPYMSDSITDFWRRWHITLGSWFRDYVYIPMGGNRVSRNRWILNIFVVWFLSGMWHGANWTFIIWGVSYFVLLFLEKTVWGKWLGEHKIFAHIYSVLIVWLLWVIFRTPTVSEAGIYYLNLLGIGTSAFADGYFAEWLSSIWLIVAIAVLLLFPKVRNIYGKADNRHKVAFDSIISFAVIVLSIMSCLKSEYNPFIYFNF